MSALAPSPSSAADAGDRVAVFARARLIDRLDFAVRSAVTLLAGPAGSGKSTLIELWSSSRPDLPVVVVPLDRTDDLGSVCRRAVDAAMASAALLDRGARARLHGAARTSGPAGLSAVLDELSRVGPLVVVYDGLDAPADPAVAAAVASALVERRPGIHHVVTVRSSKARCLATIRRSVGVAEIGADELAFTCDEIRNAIHRSSGVLLDDEQVAALAERTEGWPFAVGVAGVAVRAATDVDGAIATISGRNPHIAAFIAEEVLADLTPVMRQFLVRTSPLDPLVGALCDAVAGRSTGSLTLRYLEQAGVPITPVSPRSPFRRYGRLVHEYLREELRLSGSDAESEVLHRAARWCAEHDDPDSAARYLAAVEDWEGLIRLVDECGQTWFERGEADRVARWMEAVPVQGTQRAPVDALRLAYLHTMEGRTRRGAEVIREAEVHGVDRATALCFDMLRAAWIFIDATPESSGRAAERVLALLDEVTDDELPDVLGLTNRHSLHTVAAGALAKGAWLQGHVGRSREMLADLLARPGLYPPWRIHLHSSMALLNAWEGDLRMAEDQADVALGLARSEDIGHHPAIVDALLALGHVRRERGDLHRATVPLQRAHAIATRFRRPSMQAVHAVELAAVSLAGEAPERALEVVRSLWVDGEPSPPPTVERRLRAEAVRALLTLRHPTHARALLEEGASPRVPELASARVALAVAEGDLADAEDELRRWSEDGASTRSALDRDLWTAIVHLKSGRRLDALKMAERTFAAAEVEGHVQFISDAGPPGADLLRAVLHSAPTARARTLAARASHRSTVIGLDLSDRELEVVRFLPTPLSNTEMAARLYVSLNTLKTHLRSIYRKLGVNGRRDAVLRAQELGIA